MENTPHFLKEYVNKPNKDISRPKMEGINEDKDDIGIYLC
jgi:hypothetical protein